MVRICATVSLCRICEPETSSLCAAGLNFIFLNTKFKQRTKDINCNSDSLKR